MYNLLLVEDENIIREGLKHIISNMGIPIGTIYDAVNGADAMSILNDVHIDIIISDIRMPSMDGLTFIKKAKELNPDLGIIILSGFSEFKYAEEAIHLGVVEYLLKPLNKEKLTNAIKKIITTIEQRNYDQSKTSAYHNEISDLHNKLLWELLSHNSSKSKIESELQKVGFPFRNVFYFVISVQQSDGRSLLQNTNEFLSSVGEVMLTQSEYGYDFYLVSLSEDHLIGSDNLQKIIKKTSKTIANDPYIGFSRVSSQVEMIPILIDQAKLALDNRLIFTTERVFIFKEPKEYIDFKMQQKIHELIKQLATVSTEAYSNILKSFFEHLITSTPVQAKMIITYCAKICQELINDSTESVVDYSQNIGNLFSSSHSLVQFIDCFSNYLQKQLLLKRSNQSLPVGIERALDFVHTHFDEDITLENIAKQASMNPSYFSTLFKKQVGMTFVKYLQTYRIKKAIVLLTNPEIKIHEVAELVGFKDEKYFYKVFKKITGYTPRSKSE